MSSDKPTGAEKRGFYVFAFCAALGIDVLVNLLRGQPYKPSLVGLAIMIAAVLYFAYSWIRER